MIELKRFGVRADGNPVIETSTYIPAASDHPLAVELPGHEGFWVRIAVGNAFSQVNATEISETEYINKVSELEDFARARDIEADVARAAAVEELDAKKNEVRAELSKLGLSDTTIKAILDQVRQG